MKRTNSPRAADHFLEAAAPGQPMEVIWQPSPDTGHGEQRAHLMSIIETRSLLAIFQPIVSMPGGRIIGYEGLIRGPSDSPLHSPINLFRAAQQFGVSLKMERLCREIVIETFAKLKLAGKLFLNVSPECLLQPHFTQGETLNYMRKVGLSPETVIIELTESQPTYDYNLLREATIHYRSMGLQIAIDDLGEGFSSLRLWSELQPDFVKIDRHFIQNINQDPVKLQFVKSIQQIADNSNAQVIAEGIETEAEFLIIKDLGINLGQGYFISRPSHNPPTTLPPAVANAYTHSGIRVYPANSGIARSNTARAQKLMIAAPPVRPDTANEDVYELLVQNPQLNAVPVVSNGVPVGLISRYKMIDFFSRLYARDLYGRKPCSRIMDTAPLVVDKDLGIASLSQLIVASDVRYLSDGFIITENGKYAGIGTGHDLMREITEMQIHAARYANPLTLLPGNVPINEHIDRLIQSRVQFVACYCDLDHFKPFNDRYGYRRGDDVIQATARVLSQACAPERDFVGHVGGDDFIVLFQSDDWEARCRKALEAFQDTIVHFFSAEDRRNMGYTTEDRRGQQMFHPLTAISIGAVVIPPDVYSSHHEIAEATAQVKKQAKRISGNSLFIERRKVEQQPARKAGKTTLTPCRLSPDAANVEAI
jgi:diguanylate cyclase (GGDEF)-like protein